MDFAYPAHTEATRQRVRDFLADQLPSDWKGSGALEGAAYEAFGPPCRNMAGWRLPGQKSTEVPG